LGEIMLCSSALAIIEEINKLLDGDLSKLEFIAQLNSLMCYKRDFIREVSNCPPTITTYIYELMYIREKVMELNRLSDILIIEISMRVRE